MTVRDNSREQVARCSLKFAPPPLRNLICASEKGALAATVRYQDERNLTVGDTIAVINAETGEKVGTATIRQIATVPVRRALAVIAMAQAEYSLETTADLVDALNDYYEDQITPETKVKILIFTPTIEEI